jgi:hypothetical protein
MPHRMTTNNIKKRAFSFFMNEFRLAMICLGFVSIISYPIAMAVAARDITYLYIGIGAWALLALGLHGIYRRFRPYIREQLCAKTSSTP